MVTELDKLEEQIKALQLKRQEILDNERGGKLEEVKAEVARYGFTATELGFSIDAVEKKKKGTATKSTLPPKYRNPDNSEQTWHGGRGKRPTWVNTYLESGKKLEDIEIK